MPGIRRRALIDVEAFAAQATDAVLDARADAFGHGLEVIAPAALGAGVGRIVVSTIADAAIAHRAGFRPEAVRVDRTGAGASASPYGLGDSGRPVLSLVGEVVALKRVAAAVGVSYGYTYRTDSPTTLALVALGYADGVPRLASNRARVFVDGSTHPLVGRIAMDQFVLDVGDADVTLGAEAVLFGDPRRGEPSALDWGRWTERDPLAVTAGIASRVLRMPR